MADQVTEAPAGTHARELVAGMPVHQFAPAPRRFTRIPGHPLHREIGRGAAGHLDEAVPMIGHDHKGEDPDPACFPAGLKRLRQFIALGCGENAAFAEIARDPIDLAGLDARGSGSRGRRSHGPGDR